MAEQTMSALEVDTHHDEEMEALVPPLEDYAPTAIRLWNLLKWPMLLIIINVALFSGLVAIATSTWFSLAVIMVLLLIDAVLCYRAVLIVKNEKEILGGGASSVEGSGALSQPDPSAVKYATASKQIDQFFGPVAPKTTFFISFLSVLWALALAAGVGCASSFLFRYLAPDSCIFRTKRTIHSFYSGWPLPVPNATLANVPPDIQQNISHRSWQSQDNFVKLQDGSAFFSGTGTNVNTGTFPMLLRHLPNGTLESYPSYQNPRVFAKIGEEKQPQGFCLGFGMSWNGRTSTAECYSLSDGFVGLPVTNSSGRYYNIAVYFYTREINNTGEVWIAQWSSYRHGPPYTQLFSLYRVELTDNATLAITTIQQDLLLTDSKSSEDESELKDCSSGMRWVAFGISAIVLGCESLVLYHQGISSSLAQSAAGVVALLINTNITWLGELISLSVVYVLTLALLLPKTPCAKRFIWNFFIPEQIIWALYSILFTVAISVVFLSSLPVPGSILVVASVLPIALILNHPIFQLVGVLMTVMAIVMAACSAVYFPGITLAIIYAIGSFVSTSVGSCMRRYRLHMIVYGKQICTFIYRILREKLLKKQSHETSDTH